MSTTIYSANYCPSSISLFHDSNGNYHLIYMITNKINNKIYIGKHSTKNPHDDYMGSGKAINAAINKYGLENFEKTILYCFNSENEAYIKESEIVDETFVKRSDTYNMKCGGKGFKSYDVSGENNPMYGRTGENHPRFGKLNSKEWKEYMSRLMTGRQFSQEWKDKIKMNHADLSGDKHPWFGCKHKEISKNKMSIAKKGKYCGKNNPAAKTIIKLNLQYDIITEYGTLKDTALDNECSMNTILKYIKLQKPYKGYYYRYKEKDNEQTT